MLGSRTPPLGAKNNSCFVINEWRVNDRSDSFSLILYNKYIFWLCRESIQNITKNLITFSSALEGLFHIFIASISERKSEDRK